MGILFTIIGAIGLILISVGVILKNEVYQDILFIIGGIFLGIYSIYIGSVIFIILQLVFIATASLELLTMYKKKKK